MTDPARERAHHRRREKGFAGITAIDAKENFSRLHCFSFLGTDGAKAADDLGVDVRLVASGQGCDDAKRVRQHVLTSHFHRHGRWAARSAPTALPAAATLGADFAFAAFAGVARISILLGGTVAARREQHAG